MMKRIGYCLLLLFVALGCIPDLPVQPVLVNEGYPEGAKVTVSFSASNIAGMPGTKTLDAQVSLDSLYLAVFGSSGYLKEYVKADSIMHVNDTALTFKATLTLSDKPRSIHFIGNGPSTLDFGYDTDILPSLLSKDEAQSYWQMMESVLITADLVDGKYVSTCNDQFQDIPLVRNFAKIELSADTASYFEPTSFAVFNVPSKGSVVPYYEKAGKKLFVKNYDTCGFVTLTTKIGYPGNLPDSTDFIWSPAKYDSLVSCKATPLSEVYLYERPVPTSQNLPTYVIVKGAYNGNPNDPDSVNHFTRWTGKEYYYKIDLMEGGEYYPILRNFKYQIRINKILSRGHDTPEAAAASAGSADVSADITTSHLNDISDGEARLVVQPWMSYAFTKKQTNNKVLSVKFFSDVMTGDPDMSYGSVTCEILPMPDGEDDVIESVSIGHPVLASGTEKGWRTITFSTTEPGAPGTAARTQVLRVSGTYKTDNDEPRTLYRDVRITLQPLQRMQLSVDSPDDTGSGVPRDTAKIVRLNVGIPVDLTESMFPITFVIEPEDMSLTPDNQILNNNLPVAAQTSISDHAGYAGKRAFQFSRTLTYAEYRTLPPSLDLDGEPIRTFTCQFKTTRRDNATTIWVANEYFSKAHVSFRNPLANRLNYFYVEAREESIDQCMVKLEYSANNNQKLQFQKNDDGWATYSSNSEIRLKAGDRVYFRGNVKNWSGVTKFTGQGLYNVGGNIASLFCNDFTSEDIDLHWGEDQTGWLFTSFFLDEQGLVDASELVLPMATMTEKGYQFMFQGCTSLTAAPELPATTLANNCYQSMFINCISLEKAPKLRAATLVKYCYYHMFEGCKKLNEVTMLGRTIPETSCLTDWLTGAGTGATACNFYGYPETILGAALPNGWVNRREFYVKAKAAGTISYSGTGLQYSKNWAGAKTDEEGWTDESINSITVAEGDIIRFKGVRSNNGTIKSNDDAAFDVGGNILSLAGNDYLSASMSASAFAGLFENATTLESAETLILPSKLTPNCFERMFNGCSSLTAAPALPATTLAAGCYQSMFAGCIALTSSPQLPAETLVANCYEEMFKGCSLLSLVDCAAKGNINDTDYTKDWMSGVAPTGTFIKDLYAEWTTGDSGIPSGWTVPHWDGFYVEAVDNVTIQINVNNLYYSTDASTWPQYSKNTALSVAAGKRIWFKGTNTETMQTGETTKFQCTGGRFKIGGNIMSLRYGDSFETQGGTCGVQFTNMFKNHNGGDSGLGTLIDASKLVLPSTTLSVKDTYKSMFDGCTYLTAGPAELPATSLAATCYRNMFKDCPSLVNGPRILAVSSNSSAFQQMFLNCTSLQYIYIMVSTCPSEAFTNWVNGVPAGGTFVKNSNNNAWGTSGNASIPSGWTVQNVTP